MSDESDWKGPGERPHDYFPDIMAMGDCMVCGHTYESHLPPKEADTILSPKGEGAEAVARGPLKLLVDQEWLDRRIATDPDGCVEAGAEAPSVVAALRDGWAAEMFNAGHTVSQRSWTDADVTEEEKDRYRRAVDRALAKALAALSPQGLGASADGWQPIETAPKDGTPFYARHQSPYRFQPYKPTSEQYRCGRRGRWQTMNDYGGWENCPEPVGDWKPHPDFPAPSPTAGDE